MTPRSTGCRACVRRKVKLDATRPICKCGGKAGIDCPGFRDGFKFVHETKDVLKRHVPAKKENVNDDSYTAVDLIKSDPSSPQLVVYDEIGFCRPKTSTSRIRLKGSLP